MGTYRGIVDVRIMYQFGHVSDSGPLLYKIDTLILCFFCTPKMCLFCTFFQHEMQTI